MSAPNAWQLMQVVSIAQATLLRLVQSGAVDSDEEALLDALRPEVPEVDDVLVRLLRAMGEAKANGDAVAERVRDLNARSARAARQAEEYRSAVYAILDALGMTKWRHAEFTVSVSAGRPGVAITDVDALPAGYVRVTRSPDKAAIKAAMEQGEVIPGAEWQNSIPTLTIRTK